MVFYITNTAVRGRARRLASWLYVRLVNLLFNERFRYTNGTNIFRTRILQQIPIRTNGFSYQTEAVVKAVRGGVDWIEVGIELQARRSGDSKALTWNNLKLVAQALSSLWWDVMVRGRSRYQHPGQKLGTFSNELETRIEKG